MRRILIAMLIVGILALSVPGPPVQALPKNLSADVLTGYTTSPWSLDRYYTDGEAGNGYSALEVGTWALVITSSKVASLYIMDNSGDAEDSPNCIKPDYQNVSTPYSGNLRWKLAAVLGTSFSTYQDDVADGWKGYEKSSNGSNFMGWLVPNAITDDLQFRLTDTNPSANDFMLFGAPSSNESAQTWGSFGANDFDITGGAVSLDYSNGQKASDTQPGFLTETATAAETTTGTDATRAVTPDGLAGSVYGEQNVSWCVFDNSTTVATGDSDFSFVVPATLNGFDLVDVTAAVDAQGGTSGSTDVQIIRRRSGTPANMLTTETTISYNEYYANDETVNGSNDDLQTGDQLYVNVSGIPTGGTPSGLTVTATFRKP